MKRCASGTSINHKVSCQGIVECVTTENIKMKQTYKNVTFLPSKTALSPSLSSRSLMHILPVRPGRANGEFAQHLPLAQVLDLLVNEITEAFEI